MGNINRTDYRELNQILWDFHANFIAPKLALELYERRWAHVDQRNLQVKEEKLIKQLITEFGNGIFMPATY